MLRSTRRYGLVYCTHAFTSGNDAHLVGLLESWVIKYMNATYCMSIRVCEWSICTYIHTYLSWVYTNTCLSEHGKYEYIWSYTYFWKVKTSMYRYYFEKYIYILFLQKSMRVCVYTFFTGEYMYIYTILTRDGKVSTDTIMKVSTDTII